MGINAYWYRRTDSRPWLRLQGFEGGRNFGDEYCSDFVKWWTSLQPRRTRLRRGRLITGGSILHLVNRGDTVLSVGARSAGSRARKDVQYLGARGPLSAEVIDQQVGFATDKPFIGDIGFFVNDVYQYEGVKPGRHSLLVLPHYRHARRWHRIVSRDNRLRNQTFLRPSASPRAVATAVYLHDSIVTSSLHGLIFGLSLRRIVYWIAPPTDEPMFKYSDLLASIRLSQVAPIPDIESFHFGRSLDIGSSDAIDYIRASLPSWRAFNESLR